MKTGIISIIVCLAVLGGAVAFMNWRAQDAGDRIDTVNEEYNNNDVVVAQEQPAEIEYSENETTTENTITVQSSFPATTDNGNLVIGSEDAPVTITEFSSLSCNHCASFHKNTLGDLKKDYVDTGMVKFVFRDFPTNKPAMDAAKLLKCVDIDERYDFMNLLFEQQLQWALSSADHRQKLMQYAALLGMPNDKAEACMNDMDVDNEIIKGLQEANAEYGVDSTPTFVINPGEKTLVGARPYGDFSTEIESLTK